MDKGEEKLVPIFEGEVMEAEIVRAVLEEHGINAFVDGEVVTSVMHSLVAPSDSVRVEVLEEDVERASACVEEALAKAASDGEGDDSKEEFEDEGFEDEDQK